MQGFLAWERAVCSNAIVPKSLLPFWKVWNPLAGLGFCTNTPALAPTAICTLLAIILSRGVASRLPAVKRFLDYIGEAIDENNLAPHIHYNHQIVSADWSSANKCWTVLAEHNGEMVKFCANFIWACQGYYRHDKGYTPDWAGLGDFGGQVIHPQHWDESVDLTDKKVVVIGSGATAATLIPNLAGKCKMVTMLQRTPTYFSPAKNADTLAEQLHALDVDEQWIHEILRKKWSKNAPKCYKNPLCIQKR